MSFLSQKIEFIKGVGPTRAKILKEELDVETVDDLLNILPFRYDDRSEFHLIKDVRNGDSVQLKGTLIHLEKVKGRRRTRLTGSFKDQSGIIELSWFRGVSWMEESLKLNREYILYGKVNIYKGKRSIAHPEMELAEKVQGRSALLPVYPSTETLNARGLGMRARRNIIETILNQARDTDFEETLTSHLTDQLQLCSRAQSYRWIHMPDSEKHLDAATDRIKFEELFFLQLRLLQRKKQREKKLIGHAFSQVGNYFNRFYSEKLPFTLTNAQKRVMKEIRADMGRGIQMNRLLQGDVGSGKTLVALMSMLIALDNGFQSCLLAPTEILAQQHYQSITESIHGIGVRTAFLSGSVKGKARKDLLQFLRYGHIHFLIGTHAILEDPVKFQNLGLAVTDEQHRFGVVQRSRLWQKSKDVPPHILVMTATPIPRTLAMAAYGDLDTSVIDELPPGRKPVKTIHRLEAHRMQVIEFMRNQIEEGHQIFIVYPIIEESEVLDLQNLQEGYENLLHYFPRPKYQISVVHGRMKADEKELEMKRFVDNKTQIMVATTVIEVGVNIPNATTMVIENAERFGLSQLHQLRGRVGRGGKQSFCILMSKSQLSAYAKERISTMCNTNDGFKIAEVDMRLRGPGDLEGTRQSGVIDFKLASLVTDGKIIFTARQLALRILEKDPDLKLPENKPLSHQLQALKTKYKDWGRIS
jgi:ATP-dependent DNA helicase RecG